jgi:hypothetical protein
MPPKMLMNTLFTAGSDSTSDSDAAIASAEAPPPTSRKFAARPPFWATTSSVAITRPAPLPSTPTSPSSFTYCIPASRARVSSGSSPSTPSMRHSSYPP